MKGTKLEQSYAELDARFHGVINAAVDGIVIIDDCGTIETFNRAAERIFGYSADEVINHNVRLLMPEPDASGHDKYIRNYVGGGEPKIIGIGREVVGRRKNGECFPLNLAIGEVQALEPRRFVGILRDITQRKAVEKTLAEREQTLRLIFDSAPIGIFTADLDGRFTTVNPALSDLVGYTVGELRDMGFADLTVETDRSLLREAYVDMANGTMDECKCDVRWQRKDGTELSISLQSVIVKSPGRSDFVIGQVVDHTDRLRSEIDSRAAQERLAHVGRVTTLGEMASAIAHEINQPLTAISAYAQASKRMLDNAGMEPSVIYETMDSIAGQALRAGDVVKRIRGFVSHRESGRILTDLNGIVHTVMEFAAMDARSHGVEIATEFEPHLPKILVDPVQIQQVCLNLIRNAIDAMEDLPEAERRLSVTTRSGDGRVQAVFVDNGPGFDPDIREHAFQPFYTTKKEGMGMGLSISHSIIVAHEGTLHFEDGTSGGTVFTVSLPEAVD